MKKMSWLMLLIFSISACSTVFGRHHDEQMVFFDSNVQGVEIVCSGLRANTPGSIPLRQSKSHACIGQLEGYEKKIFNIRSGTSGSGFGHSTAINTAIWGWWTLGIGTGIGWLVDFASGAMRNLKEDHFYLEMKPLGSTSTSQKVFDQVARTGSDLVNMPKEVVQNTSTAAIGTSIEEAAKVAKSVKQI